MSFRGDLSLVSAADLLQYLHLCRRTGTLSLRAGRLEACIGFDDGDILFASGPGAQRATDLLVQAGVLEEATLVAALSVQISERPRRALGQILLDCGALSQGDLIAASARQIESVINGLAFWTQGDFQFVSDEWHFAAEALLPPQELRAHLRLDTRRVLLEAARLSDDLRAAQKQHQR